MKFDVDAREIGTGGAKLPDLHRNQLNGEAW